MMIIRMHSTPARAIALILFCAASAITEGPPTPARQLLDAYPGYLTLDVVNMEIVWRDGGRMSFGADRPGLTFDQRLESATLFDQLSIPYPREWPTAPPSVDSDPGRLRCDAFFKKLYGGTKEAVEATLVRVPWPHAGATKSVSFTSVNGANKALEAVGAEIAKLPKDVQRYVVRPNGTFNWRAIEGTERLSPHSYGIAIDFEFPDLAARYWRWDETKNRASEPQYPIAILADPALRQIVETFERHGFIWGGKWYHYDIMHFEYRPELVHNPE
ncbi:MAG: M15 family metallopeptidase [Candidatus Hydrogenedentes bacterium]|nr:M15 family metallopeptidase [Candidatus Hydrogenedentota bacterium]